MPATIEDVLPSAKEVMKEIAVAEAEKASLAAHKHAEEEAEKRALIDQMSNEREALLNNGDRLRATIAGSHENMSHDLATAGDRITEAVASAGDSMAPPVPVSIPARPKMIGSSRILSSRVLGDSCSPASACSFPTVGAGRGAWPWLRTSIPRSRFLRSGSGFCSALWSSNARNMCISSSVKPTEE